MYKITLIAIPTLYGAYLIFTFLKWPTNVLFYVAHQINGPFCATIIYYNYRKSGNIRLIIYGMIITFVCVFLTMIMTIRYNAGYHSYYVDKYPLLYIRIGMLIDIVLYQIFLMRNWNDQEKQLAIKDLQSQIEIERLRNDISHEIHDDIGTTLSKINLTSFMASQKIVSGEKFDPKDSFDRIQHSAQEMIGNLKDIVWSIESDKNNINDFINKIEEYAKTMCAAKNITLDFNANTTNLEFIPLNVKYQIFLICKEAINNAVKYSNCTNLMVNETFHNDRLCIIIKDDGIGFLENETAKGVGIKSMKNRAGKINGNLVINSTLGQGTEVSIQLN